MPRPTNFFEANELATSGPLKGFGLWSDAENWTDGVAVDGDAVYVTSNLGDDDLDALSLDSLLVNAPMTVTGRSLTIGALTSGVPDNSEINATVLPGQGPVTVTIDTIGTAGMTIEATGAGAGAVVRTAVDQPENFAVQNGGEVEIAVTPASVWNLNYDSASVGRFALDDPAASNAISLQHVRAGDVLELPGVSVSNVTFGTDSLSITTSAGVYAFTNVAYDHAPKSYSAAVDPVTGLVAITFADQNVFTPSTKAASGALSGDYVWSNAANWAGGVPVDGEAVSAGATGYDDIAALQLSSLTLNEAGAAANVFVTGASLTIADLEQSGAGGSGMLEVDAADAGAPVTVTLQQSGVVGATFEAKGAHAKFLDQAPTDTTSNTYDVANGGLVELSNAPYSGDVFSYTSSGTFAFKSPGAVVASLMLGVSIGDTIELPGTTVSNVTFGSDSLAITTDAGTYDFDAVTYNPGSQIDGYTAAVDPVTGLEAITFRGPNTFTPTVQVAHSTPGPFLFLWSEPANWSGGTPIEGDTVLTTYTSLVTEYQLGVDDLPNLTLSSLTLALANHVEVEAGSSLTIDSLTEGTETTLSADSTDPTKPAVLTIDTLTGSYYEADISAIGAGATVIDQSATDPVGLYGSGAIYFVSLGGKLEIQSATPASTSRLEYFNSSGTPDGGLGTIALGHPGATNAVLLEGVAPGDVLELPGDAVSAVSFGAGSLSVTTNAGSYDFTNVIYADPVIGYTAAKDPSTGLVAITFSGPDVFEMNVNVTSGPLAGEYLWSNAANWSRGLPVNNDTVVFANPSGYSEDDITTLTLNSLTLGAGGHVYVEGGSSLTVANLVGTTGSELFPDSADDGITAPSSVTVGSITGTGALYAAKGTGASFIDQSPSDAGEIYLASSGGVFELAAAPADASSLGYVGVATFALQHPSASSAASLQGVAPGDVLELPGTSVSAVTFGANSLSVTTDTGTYAFTNVTYATSVTGYTVAHDPVTGLEVITFTGPDVFEQNVKATSGKFAGDYLWSNPANWSQGHAPVDGDSVVVADQAAVGYDDIASLALSRLSLNGSDLYVVGSNLTVASVTGGAHFVGNTFWYPTLWADASDAGAPVTVTIGAITDGPIANTSFTGEYYAVGSGARLIDQSNTDLGNEFFAGGGGLFQSSAVPASPSLLIYGSNLHGAYQPGPGTIALAHPGATNPGLLSNVGPGDVLELPGTSVNAVTFGTHSLSLTTNAGSYDFTNVNYLSPVTGYTTRFDPTTGLEAITFTGPDVFEANFKATSGKFAGDYLWSNPANWSQGHAPVDGDSVQIGTTNIVGYDDIASLSLSTLTLHLSTVNVVGQSLTVGTVNGGGVFAPQPQGGFSFLIADAAEAGAPVSVVVDTVTGTRGTYGAEGAGATFHDNSAVDPGDTYEMIGGGTVYLSATPASGTPASDYSDFWYGNGAAVLELPHAAGVSGSDIDFGPGNVLELPGSKVLSVGFTNGLSVTTDAGSYQFTGVASNVAGYSWADDASTGLVAITFTKTAPAAPALALLHDTGISATDHITNDPTLHYVLSNIADTFRFSVDGSGFSAVAPDFAAHPLADGVHTVSVEEVDPAGNASAASHLSFTLDTAAPHWTGLTASPGSGSAFAGTTVQLTLDFNEAVDVRGGTPSLTLNDGGTALYDAAATALLGDSSKLVFDHLVTSNTPSTTSLAVTGLVAHGATISDVAGNNSPADLSHVTATFGALAINESFAPAYSANGFTRPQLELDATGHIILDAAASAFAATYGIEFLYLGLPPSTPYPPVADASHDFHMP